MLTAASFRTERWSCWPALGLCLATLACSSNDRERTPLSVRDGDPEGPVFYEMGTTDVLAAGGSAGSAMSSANSNTIDGLVDGQPPPRNAPISIKDACVMNRAEATL